MKTTSLVFLLLSIIVSAYGQPLPDGNYVAQPSDNRVRVYWTDYLAWPKICHFEAEFNQAGQVAKMNYQGGSADQGTSFEFVFPSEDQKTKFKNLETWKKFAARVYGEFVFINQTNETYIEKTPYVFIGRSVILDSWEYPNGLQALVFKKGDRLLAVPLPNWRGEIPTKVGQEVTIGQDHRGECIFAAKMVKGWQIPEETGKEKNANKK